MCTKSVSLFSEVKYNYPPANEHGAILLALTRYYKVGMYLGVFTVSVYFSAVSFRASVSISIMG